MNAADTPSPVAIAEARRAPSAPVELTHGSQAVIFRNLYALRVPAEFPERPQAEPSDDESDSVWLVFAADPIPQEKLIPRRLEHHLRWQSSGGLLARWKSASQKWPELTLMRDGLAVPVRRSWGFGEPAFPATFKIARSGSRIQGHAILEPDAGELLRIAEREEFFDEPMVRFLRTDFDLPIQDLHLDSTSLAGGEATGTLRSGKSVFELRYAYALPPRTADRSVTTPGGWSVSMSGSPVTRALTLVLSPVSIPEQITRQGLDEVEAFLGAHQTAGYRIELTEAAAGRFNGGALGRYPEIGSLSWTSNSSDYIHFSAAGPIDWAGDVTAIGIEGRDAPAQVLWSLQASFRLRIE
ncbi:hypothetical protein [Panacagrimonas sp.]|uniref:hypothetical protein n=1 Tax=Panacagrimonas sp. TaxID=2480088 RepID=UPI003B520C85